MSKPNIDTNVPPQPSIPPLSPASPSKPSPRPCKPSSSLPKSSLKPIPAAPQISGFTLVPLSIMESLTASHAAIRTEIQLADTAIERTLPQDIVLARPPPGKIYVQNRTLEKNFESIRKSQEELRKLLNELAEMRCRREQGVLGAFDILSRDGSQLLDEAKLGREERGRDAVR